MQKPFIAQFGIISGNSFLQSVSGKAAINSTSSGTYNLDINGTEGILLPSGNTGQRPPGANGLIRYNTESATFEGYVGGAWGPIGGSSGGDVTNTYLQTTFLKLSGGTISGTLSPNANTVLLGTSTLRWVLAANTGDFSGAVTTSTGVYPASNTVGTGLGATDRRFALYANAISVSGSINPVSNAAGDTLGSSTARFNITANTIGTSGGVTPVSNTSGSTLGTSTARFTLHANSVIVSDGLYPLSNTTGINLGSATQRFNLYANTFDVSGTIAFGNRFVANSSMTTSILTAAGSLGAFEVKNDTGNASFFSINRNGVYATYIGLDNDSQFTVGGWSSGTSMGLAKFGGLGVGTASIGSGSIVATGDIHSAYSDIRLKDNLVPIICAMSKVKQLLGFTYSPNDIAIENHVGKEGDRRMGLSAQDVQMVAPECVSIAPFDMDKDGNSKSGNNYLTVKYERLVPLLVEAIKELSIEIEMLKGKINGV